MLTVEFKNGMYIIKYKGKMTGVSSVDDVARVLKEWMG